MLLASWRSCVRWRMSVGSEVPRVFTPPLRELTPDTSLGFSAVAFAEEVLGIVLLPWQRWLFIHALETLPDGSLRFRTVLLLVARQNGKSTALQVLALYFMFVRALPLVIGTAQNLDIAEEVWQGAVDLAEGVAELAAEIETVDRTNGKKALVLTGGQRYKVQAANRRGGRGLSADLVMLDELREHQKWDAWGAVTKTTLARPHAQVWAASNAGDRSSVVLSYLRMMGHASVGDPDRIVGDSGADNSEGSLGLFEWSAAPGLPLDDPTGIADANPSLGHTITARAIEAARQTDPEEVFRTEVLCQWVDQMSDGLDDLNVTTWSNCEDKNATPGGALSLAVDVAPHGATASVVVCGVDAASTLPVLELVEYRRGTGWIVDRVRQLCTDHGVSVVTVDPSGPVGAIVPDLEAAGVALNLLDSKNVARATTSLVASVAAGTVRHRGQSELLSAVAGSRRRASGDGERWSRTNSHVDISPLVAATWAHWTWATFDQPDILNSVW